MNSDSDYLFLKEDELEKLLICFVNNYSLGQMEIAFAYLKLIKSKKPEIYNSILGKIMDKSNFQDVSLSQNFISTAHFNYYISFEIDKGRDIFRNSDILSKIDSTKDNTEFEMLLIHSLKDGYELNNNPIFDENDIEELRFFFYYFKLNYCEERIFSKEAADYMQYLPYFSFINYSGNSSSLGLSFLKEKLIKKNLDQFKNSKGERNFSEETLEKYKIFLRVHPKTGFIIHKLFLQYVTQRVVPIAATLQKLYLEILAELLHFSNYNFFYLYLKNLEISDKIKDDSLKELFSVVFKIFEDQENYKVTGKTKFSPNAGILARLKVLGSLNDSTPYNYISNELKSIFKEDSANCLLKSKVVEALIANGNSLVLELFNQLDAIHTAERNKRSALPFAYSRLRILKDSNDESKLIHTADIDSLIKMNLNAKNGSSSQKFNSLKKNQFWREFFKFIYVQKEHCLEYPLKNAYEFLKERKLDLSTDLITPFESLKPLLLVMSLNCFKEDIASLDTLISKLWLDHYENLRKTDTKRRNPYKKIEDKCEEIYYNMRVAHWLSEFSSSELGNNLQSLKEANRIFLNLERNSLILTLKDYLKALDIDELIAKINEIAPVLSPKLILYHNNNYHIILIFAIMNEIISLIILRVSEKKINPPVLENALEKVFGFISLIKNEDYILILCEFLLKTIRLSNQNLKFVILQTQERVSAHSQVRLCLINKTLADHILQIIEKSIQSLGHEALSNSSKSRLDKIKQSVLEYRMKMDIVHKIRKLISLSWKDKHAQKKTILKLNDKDEHLFKSNSLLRNKEIYSSYYMNYLLMEETSLVKLAVANYLFEEAKAYLGVFKLGEEEGDETSLNQLFTNLRLNWKRELLDKGFERNIQKISELIDSKQDKQHELNNSFHKACESLVKPDEDFRNHQLFKYITELTLCSEIEIENLIVPLKKAQDYLQKSVSKNVGYLSDYLNRMLLLIDHNLNNQEIPKNYPISHLICDTKNIENVSVEPAMLIEYLSQKWNEKNTLVLLAEKLKDLNNLKASLIQEEIYNLINNTIEILSKTAEEREDSSNFVKLFMKYILEIGETMKYSIAKHIDEDNFKKQLLENFNYGILLITEPKILIGTMIFFLKCEKESIQMAQRMNINVLEVILSDFNAKQLKTSSFLSLFNFLSKCNFRIKTRTINFVYDIETSLDEYKFISGVYGSRLIDTPIFSLLALLERSILNYSDSVDYYRKFKKLKDFLTKCLKGIEKNKNWVYCNYIRLILKNINFLWTCLESAEESKKTKRDDEARTKDEGRKTRIFYLEKEIISKAHINDAKTRKNTDFEDSSKNQEEKERENIVKSVLSQSNIFSSSSEANKKAEHLFPKNLKHTENTKPSKEKNSVQDKRSKIAAYLPPPSKYISNKFQSPQEKEAKNYRVGNPEHHPNEKQEVPINSPSKSAKEAGMIVKCEKILADKLGNYIGFFEYKQEEQNNRVLFAALLESGKFELAIELLEKKLNDPNRMDEVLTRLLKSEIFRQMSEEEKFKIISKSSSLETIRAELANLIEQSTLYTAKNFINYTLNGLKISEVADLKEELENKRHLIDSILFIDPEMRKWRSLEEFGRKFREESLKVINELLDQKQFGSLRKLVEIKGKEVDPEIIQLIQKREIVYYLNQASQQKDRFLEAINDYRAIDDLETSLEVLELIQDLEIKALLCTIIEKKLADSIDNGGVSKFDEVKKKIESMSISLQILLSLNERLRKKLEPLLFQPTKIIHHLITIKKIDSLETIMPNLSNYLDDNTILEYAYKVSLDYFLSKQKGSQRMSKVWEEIEGEMDLKPDFKFFKQLILMCSDKELVAESCLKIADSLSSILTDYHEAWVRPYKCIVLEYIKKLILLSRKIFRSIDEGLNVARCEKYLNFLELIENLLRNELKYKISLKRFFNKELVGDLINFLIENDYLRFALEVCEKCEMNSSSVLFKWIDWLIRFERFEDARKILSGNLFTELIENLTCSEVSNIVASLETITFESTAAYLDYKKGVFSTLMLLKRNGNQNAEEGEKSEGVFMVNILKELKKKFDDQIFEEAVFILKNYGLPQQLINFYVKKGMFTEACKYVFMENLQPEIFVNEILENCLVRNKREELQAAIKAIDPHMNRSWNYLTACCQYLLQKNLSDHLYSFQLFMKEYGKAAIRCLKQYLEVDSVEEKLQFLSKAEQHFNEAISAINAPFYSSSRMGNSEKKKKEREYINYMIKLISFQREILHNYPEYKHVHLFVEDDSKMEIVEIFLRKNIEFSLKLIEVLGLQVMQAVRTLLLKLAKERNLEEIERFIEVVISWIKTGAFHKMSKSALSAEFDHILFEGIQVLCGDRCSEEENGISKNCLLPLINDELTRMKAYVACREHRKALSLAAKSENCEFLEEIIRLVKDAEEKTSEKGVETEEADKILEELRKKSKTITINQD